MESLQKEVTLLQDMLKKNPPDVMARNMDDFFLVVMSIIIYFMQCGFAFLECGAVRSKNSTNILIKNVLDCFMAGFAYWIVGYPLAFGSTEDDNNPFIGTMYWAHSGLPPDHRAAWFFQMVFAATAATIVSGAMAERCDFPAYLAYSFFLTGFMYPVVTHWAWSDYGWLKQGSETCCVCPSNNSLPCDVTVTRGYVDFAGSGVVHLFGGMAALMGAVFLGPRMGRFDDEGNPVDIKGHSVPLAALGGFILFLGFFAFNSSSQGHISQAGDGEAVATACINTIISGTFAAFTCLFTNRVYSYWSSGDHYWSLLTTINGALTGMVAVCAAADSYHTWAAAVVGAVAGGTYMLWSWLILRLKIDDPLDSVAVHGGGGLWGVLAAPILKEGGIVFNWSRPSFVQWGWHFAAAISISAWSALLAAILFGILKLVKLLRVDPELESKGLDIPKHGEPAYPVDSYGHGWGEKGDTLASMARIVTKHSAMAMGSIEVADVNRKVNTAVAFAQVKRHENAEKHAHCRKQFSDVPEPEFKRHNSDPPKTQINSVGQTNPAFVLDATCI